MLQLKRLNFPWSDRKNSCLLSELGDLKILPFQLPLSNSKSRWILDSSFFKRKFIQVFDFVEGGNVYNRLLIQIQAVKPAEAMHSFPDGRIASVRSRFAENYPDFPSTRTYDWSIGRSWQNQRKI